MNSFHILIKLISHNLWITGKVNQQSSIAEILRFIIITQWWAVVDFVTQNGQIFLNIQNICGHKSETMWCMWSKVSMGSKHHRYYKHTKFCQNPSGDPKFLVDLTRNDPYVFLTCMSFYSDVSPVYSPWMGVPNHLIFLWHMLACGHCNSPRWKYPKYIVGNHASLLDAWLQNFL